MGGGGGGEGEREVGEREGREREREATMNELNFSCRNDSQGTLIAEE